eukprot:2484546-Rhodomonas_salina.1
MVSVHFRRCGWSRVLWLVVALQCARASHPAPTTGVVEGESAAWSQSRALKRGFSPSQLPTVA